VLLLGLWLRHVAKGCRLAACLCTTLQQAGSWPAMRDALIQ
jgi:hypothetical protein